MNNNIFSKTLSWTFYKPSETLAPAFGAWTSGLVNAHCPLEEQNTGMIS